VPRTGPTGKPTVPTEEPTVLTERQADLIALRAARTEKRTVPTAQGINLTETQADPIAKRVLRAWQRPSQQPSPNRQARQRDSAFSGGEAKNSGNFQRSASARGQCQRRFTSNFKPYSEAITMKARTRVSVAACAVMLICVSCSQKEKENASRSFATPEEAVAALGTAAEKQDVDELRRSSGLKPTIY
jgi:hypothetical protein